MDECDAIVPLYGVTRFGQPGLTLLSGHDDIDGSIVRYLDTLRRGDMIQVWPGQRACRYTVTSVPVVAPEDAR